MKRDIISKVWGVANPVGDGSLDYQVHILRKMLDDDPAKPQYIETKKRHGIQFIASVKLVCEEVTDTPVTDKGAQANSPQPATLQLSGWISNRRILAVSVLIVVGLIIVANYFRDTGRVRPSVTVNSDGS